MPEENIKIAVDSLRWDGQRGHAQSRQLLGRLIEQQCLLDSESDLDFPLAGLLQFLVGCLELGGSAMTRCSNSAIERAHFRLRPFALGDVEESNRQHQSPSPSAAHWMRPVFHGEGDSIRPPHHLIVYMHVIALPQRAVGSDIRPAALAFRRAAHNGQGYEDFLRARLFASRVTQHLHAGLIDPGAVAFRIDAADRFGGRIQKEPDVLFLFPQSHFSFGARCPRS